VLVHNFRPGVPARFGIDYERLRERDPRLVCCAPTGYGESGPIKDRAGYDQVLQSITGICTCQGPPGEPRIVYGSVVDYYAAAQIAYGVTAPLYHRERTGEGRHIGVSLLGSALAMQSGRFIWADNEGRDVARDLRSGGTMEGYIYISANTPHFWQSLCELVGLPELARDPGYDTVRKRSQHAAEIVPRIRTALRCYSDKTCGASATSKVAKQCPLVRAAADAFLRSSNLEPDDERMRRHLVLMVQSR
jgi:crotonobetainyl-CoA:carnitine CoA-transferase CaiB-like acyl-CoA transferase